MAPHWGRSFGWPMASLRSRRAEQAVLERVADGAALEVQRIHLNKSGMATELHNGDIVRLLPVVPRFENAVTLRGNVADPGRFPWHAGMRLSDLIPNKESLLTRDYWKERNHLAVKRAPGVARAFARFGRRSARRFWIAKC